jgi:hypothetical protein
MTDGYEIKTKRPSRVADCGLVLGVILGAVACIMIYFMFIAP